MKPKPTLPPHEMTAYYHAAQAVVAHRLNIAVHRITIMPDVFDRTYTHLQSLESYFLTCLPKGYRTTEKCENYVSTLLAGIVGRQIRLERHLGYTMQCTGLTRLNGTYRKMLAVCKAPDLDRAFAISLGWLSAGDQASPIDIMRRLWLNVQVLLREPENDQLLVNMAQQLMEVRVMDEQAIKALLIKK